MVKTLLIPGFQVLAPNPGGRKARPYDTLLNLLGRGEVYPRPHRTGYCTNLRIEESLNLGKNMSLDPIIKLVRRIKIQTKP